MTVENETTKSGKFFSKIGRCGTCMRQSFAAAAMGWVVVVATEWAQFGEIFNRVAMAFAVGLSLLWLLHAATYVFRALARDRRSDRAQEVAALSARRNVLTLLARSAAGALLVSTPIVLYSSGASAFCGQCTIQADCGTCRCVNTAPVNSGKVCNECVCP